MSVSPSPLATACLLALLAAPAGAGRLEVLVSGVDGRPLREIRIALAQYGSSIRRPHRLLISNEQGRVRFDGLSPGYYRLAFPDLPSSLVQPRLDPYAATTALTVLEEDDELELEIVLRPGFPLTAFVDLNGAPTTADQVLFRHRATGKTVTARFVEWIDGRPAARQVLATGVWDVIVDAPSGWLLVGVDHEGDPLPGYQATVDLVLEPDATSLAWHFAADCWIVGDVSASVGNVEGMTIAADLVAPGPWIDAAQERGGSKYQRVTANVDDTGRFEMILPNGSWRVAPAADLEESSPPFVDLHLASGETGHADFHVVFPDRAIDQSSRSALYVALRYEVPSARTRELPPPDFSGTVVEVHTAGAEEADGEGPVATVKAQSSRVVIRDLAAGDYLVTAAHPDFLEATAGVRDFEGDPRKPRYVSLEMSLGAEIRLEAVDPGGRPLPGLKLAVEKLDDGPELVSRDPDFVAAKRRRLGSTDNSGRTGMTGFYPGRYRLRVTLRGQDPASRLRLIDLAPAGADGDRRGPEIEVDLGDRELLELEARQRPSATLRATLVCSDAGAPAEAAAVSIFDALAPEGSEAILDLSAVPLEGPRHEVLNVGPLPEGAYRIAVRPAGFERVTWAFETYEPSAAQEVQVIVDPSAESDVYDLGRFLVECGPAVDIVPETAPGVPLPELRDVEAELRLVDPETGEEIPTRLSITAREDRFEVRDLPRGRVKLAFTLSHPCFVPTPLLGWETEVVDLERGSFLELAPLFDTMGGAIRVEGEGALARLTGAGVEAADVPVEDGEAWFVSLLPALYQVTLCGDAACERPLGEWRGVEVAPGETVALVAPPPSAND